MILPKKGQAWTYKDRARVYALAAALAMMILLIAAIILSAWPAIIIAIVGLAAAALTWLDAERKSKAAKEKVKDFEEKHKDELGDSPLP